MDLALVLINLARQNQDNDLYIEAYAWAKLALDSKQEGAEELIQRLTDAFPTQLVESSLRQYNRLKEQIRRKSPAPQKPL